MNLNRYMVSGMVGAAMLAIVNVASPGYATPLPPVAAARSDGAPLQLAQAPDRGSRELEPRYQPVPPEQGSWYNTDYFFAATRGVADSTLVPAAKVSLYFLTVPLDIVALPIAAIGGLFG